jgi:hypothetical protein
MKSPWIATKRRIFIWKVGSDAQGGVPYVENRARV